MPSGSRDSHRLNASSLISQRLLQRERCSKIIMLERGRDAIDLPGRETKTRCLFSPAGNGLGDFLRDLTSLGILQFEIPRHIQGKAE